MSTLNKNQKEYINKFINNDDQDTSGYLIYLTKSDNYLTSFEYIKRMFNLVDADYRENIYLRMCFSMSWEHINNIYTVKNNKNKIRTIIDINFDEKNVHIMSYIDNIKVYTDYICPILIVENYGAPPVTSIKKFMELDFPVTDRLKQLIVENW